MDLAQKPLGFCIKLKREHWTDLGVHGLTKGDHCLKVMGRSDCLGNQGLNRSGKRTRCGTHRLGPARRLAAQGI
ncbi:hypothetical protein D3C87_1317280 [compost metagenome]